MVATQSTLTKKMSNNKLSQLQQDIINNFQKGFPLCERPYLSIAEKLNVHYEDINEQTVFTALSSLDALDITSRIGPVFDHKKAGASTLAALAVNERELDNVAHIINQFEQVNHNYARSSQLGTTNYNLWFVVTASDPIVLNNTLISIEQLTGLTVLVLPMEASYHLDLAFSINVTGKASPLVNSVVNSVVNPVMKSVQPIKTTDKQVQVQTQAQAQATTLPTLTSTLTSDLTPPLTEIQKIQLRKLIESGLPKHLKPYEKIAQTINATQEQVQLQLATWQQSG
nr:hypothetical protein [Colwellia sp.]